MLRLVVALVLLWTTYLTIGAFGQTGPTIGPEAYLDQEGYWPPDARPVQVCWEVPEARDETKRQMIRAVISTVIENQSGMRFAPVWPACSASVLGIHVSVSSAAWPVSQVGRQYARGSSGQLLRRFGVFGDYIVVPTAMTLNFDLYHFKNFEGCLDPQNPDARNNQCLRTVAVHEFMHAIGFLHEQIRPDAAAEQPDCKFATNPEKDFYGYKPIKIGAYDKGSIMNYCNNIYDGEPKLSTGDLAALTLWYPRP